jgi:hypothetical protein
MSSNNCKTSDDDSNTDVVGSCQLSNGTGFHGVQFSQGVYRPLTHSRPHTHRQESPKDGPTGSSKRHHGDLENIIWIDQQAYYIDSSLSFHFIDTDTSPIGTSSSADSAGGNMKKASTMKKASPGQGHLQMGRSFYITSEDGNVNLTYTAIAQMPTDIQTPLFAGALLHTYGVYSGYISAGSSDTEAENKRVVFENVPGILEDHYAVW